ncbi:MAG: hypothetical protein AAFY57_06385 [Cyanobacteria bacterium J06642_2]
MRSSLRLPQPTHKLLRYGNLDFSEFVAAAVPNLDILKLCREFDRDRKGLLSLEEAVHATERLQLYVVQPNYSHF